MAKRKVNLDQPARMVTLRSMIAVAMLRTLREEITFEVPLDPNSELWDCVLADVHDAANAAWIAVDALVDAIGDLQAAKEAGET